MLELAITARGTTPCESLQTHLHASADKLLRLDADALRLEMELCVEKNPRVKDKHARVQLTWTSRTGIRHATADAPNAHAALEKATDKLCRQLREASRRSAPVHGGLHSMPSVRSLPIAVDEQMNDDSRWLARAYFGDEQPVVA